MPCNNNNNVIEIVEEQMVENLSAHNNLNQKSVMSQVKNIQQSLELNTISIIHTEKVVKLKSPLDLVNRCEYLCHT